MVSVVSIACDIKHACSCMYVRNICIVCPYGLFIWDFLCPVLQPLTQVRPGLHPRAAPPLFFCLSPQLPESGQAASWMPGLTAPSSLSQKLAGTDSSSCSCRCIPSPTNGHCASGWRLAGRITHGPFFFALRCWWPQGYLPPAPPLSQSNSGHGTRRPSQKKTECLPT